jgi:membrane-associated phospholipid phosphatase
MIDQAIIRLLADGMILPIVLISGYALLFLIPKGQRLDAYKRIFMAGLTSYLVAKLLGSIYQPAAERPFEVLGAAAGASYLPNPGFPSDHALFTGFLTLAVWFETRKKMIAVILAVLTLLVCLGRVLALVHTPLDVVAGLLVACLGAVWCLQRKSVVKETRSSSKNTV